MPAEHVDRQASKVEHEGGHQDLIRHGQDLAGHGHVSRLCEVNVFCRYVGRQEICMA